MSPRTYIGPFGRILPVPEDKEPERLLIPPNAADETRHPLGMYQLPPPERLHFGSDISTGFTEPVRYNTISQSSRTHGASQPMLGDQMARRGQLPSLQQLLTPSTQSNVPTPAPYSPQRSPNPPQQPPSTFSHSHNPSPDRVAHASQYHHHATYHPQSQAAAQVRLPTARSSSRENYQISSPTQNHPSFYGQQPNPRIPPHASSFEPNSQSSFASQLQQPAPPIASGQQQSHPHDLAHTQFQPVPAPPQHMQSLDAPAMYFQGQIGAYPTEIDPRMASEQSPPTPSNSVKPQPRVVAERDVPGEGPSWVYEDGTTCKKVIDGEMVNAQWGVTKAGKPRKRLAIACTTCREKKIKCDPAEPKCVQCEKFGRECRFMTA